MTPRRSALAAPRSAACKAQACSTGAREARAVLNMWLKLYHEVGLHYTDRHRLADEVEKELGVTYHADVEQMVGLCDVVTINAPLHPETENLFDDELIGKMKYGAYLVNTRARQDPWPRGVPVAIRSSCCGWRGFRF
jgi:hypothetical protein